MISVKLNVGKLGRSYVSVLWLTMMALFVFAIAKGIAEEATSPVFPWEGYAVLVVGVLVQGGGAWGVIRRRRWGYYLSLAIAVYSVSLSGYDFVTRQGRVNHWGYLLFLVPSTIALAWLVTPGARSQFSPAMKKV